MSVVTEPGRITREWCGAPFCLCVIAGGRCASADIILQIVLDAAAERLS